MSLSIVFFGLDAGIRGLLQSHREFIVPELARVAYNSVLFGFALALSGRLGVFVLAWGIVLGAALQLAIQFLGAMKQGVLKLVWTFGHPGVRRAAKQLIPFLIAVSGVQVTFVLDRMVASGLAEGDITALTYASRIVLLPVGLFALPLRTTLYPGLSALAAQSQLRQLAETVLCGLKALLFLVIPSCVGLVVLHVPLTQLLFERGAFDRMATLATSGALIYYAAGVPGIAAILVLNNVYLSLDDARSLAMLSISNWLANLSLSLLLGQYLGHYGVALGTSVSVTLTMVLMICLLKRRQLKTLDVRSLLNSVCRITSVSVVMGLLLVLLLNMSNHISLQPPLYYQFLRVAILIVIGTATYLVIGYWFKLDELTMLTTTFHKL
jgi:putative peptidoglycan lipid II flippase